MDKPLPSPGERTALPPPVGQSAPDWTTAGPNDPSSSSSSSQGPQPHSLGDATNDNATSRHPPSQYYSTTSAPLPESATAPRKTSGSILDPGRPKRGSQRPSSFFGADSQQDDAGSPLTAGPTGDRGDVSLGAEAQAGYDAAGNGMYGVRAPSPGVESSYGEFGVVHDDEFSNIEDGGGAGHGNQAPGVQARRSSFYGLSAVPAGPSNAGPVGDVDSRAYTPPSSNHRSSSRNLANQDSASGSGSGSFSSHDAAGGAQRGGFTHASNFGAAPSHRQASRAASVYAEASAATPILDQSHLHPGQLASLLSHEKTLDLYRANARKTNDPDIQFEFCTFVMEVVAEMEASRALIEAEKKKNGGAGVSGPAAAAGLTSTAAEVQDIEAKHKQQALVSESVALLNKLANRGHVKSQYFLADCYTQGIGTPKGKRDYDKAFNLFLLAGKHGHSDACYRAAQCCENGWGCKRDSGKAVTLYRRAAVLNHPGAMHRLALAELNAELGLSRRPREGVRWLKRAAELADQVDPPQPQSLHELAMLHEKGIENVIFQDEEYAAELLARASELQYAPSAYKLGECYEYGKMGCPQDSALSIHYYNIAAQQNHREACFALTAWYLVGSPGVLPQSDTEAYLWARKAAELDLAKAEYAVGYFTETGIGTYQDQREALEWFRKAASHGDKRAMDRLRIAGQPGVQPQQAFARQPQSSAQPAPGTPYKPPPITKMLKKDNSKPVPSHELNRGKSVDRGKGKQALPPLPDQRPFGQPYQQQAQKAQPPSAYRDPRRPALPRQRSASTPINGFGDAGPINAAQEPYVQNGYSGHVPPRLPDFAPLSGGSAYASNSLPPRTSSYAPLQQPSLPPGARPQPQPQMPARQYSSQQQPSQPEQAPMLDGAEYERRRAEREKVLQRRKGDGNVGGEDKDCLVM